MSHRCFKARIEDCGHEILCPCHLEKTCSLCGSQVSIVTQREVVDQSKLLNFKFRGVRFNIENQNEKISEETLLSSLFSLDYKKMVLLVSGIRYNNGSFRQGFQKGVSLGKSATLIATPKAEHEQFKEIEAYLSKERWMNFFKNGLTQFTNGIGSIFSNIFLFFKSIFVPSTHLIENRGEEAEEQHEHED